MDQLEMFPSTVQSIVFTAAHDLDSGWHLRIASRTEGDRWPSSAWSHYDSLSDSELIQVAIEEISRRLHSA